MSSWPKGTWFLKLDGVQEADTVKLALSGLILEMLRFRDQLKRDYKCHFDVRELEIAQRLLRDLDAAIQRGEFR